MWDEWKRLLRWFTEILTTETETQSASLSALFPSLRVKFRLWVTTFFHLIPVRFKKKKKKKAQCLPVYSDASSSIFEWGHCWLMMLCLWVNVGASAREREGCVTGAQWGRRIATTGRRICYSGAEKGAIGLHLGRRMSPGETHFPDKWAAVISIGLLGQERLTGSLLMAAGLESTCEDTYGDVHELMFNYRIWVLNASIHVFPPTETESSHTIQQRSE